MACVRRLLKDAYDAMELGVNLHLLGLRIMNPANDLVNIHHATDIVTGLRIMLDLLPTQTKRTDEQQLTPPHLGYIANWTAAVGQNDIFLEPSAGIGGLSVFAKLAVAAVYVNELSARRRALLEMIGFNGCFQENAEQLHNILPADITPTVIVMNPPFSSAAWRIRSRGSIADRELVQKLSEIDKLSEQDKAIVKGVLDTFIIKSRFQRLAAATEKVNSYRHEANTTMQVLSIPYIDDLLDSTGKSKIVGSQVGMRQFCFHVLARRSCLQSSSFFSLPFGI